MLKYFISRIIRGLLSIVAVIAIVMTLVYSLMDREQIFVIDTQYQKVKANAQTVYKYNKWEKYGYVDYIPFEDYINGLVKEGKLSEEDGNTAKILNNDELKDSTLTKKYKEEFKKEYESKGYTYVYLAALFQSKNKLRLGGNPYCFVYRNKPIISRLLNYFKSIISFDNIHKANTVEGKRGIKITLHDPVYGGEKFAPAIMGNGTQHKYLLYFDGKFPYLHQNLVKISLGESYSVSKGEEIIVTMTKTQGLLVTKENIYPSGVVATTSDDLHTATYIEGSRNEKNELIWNRFVDDYTNVGSYKNGKSKMTYSFIMGIISVVLAYILGVPLGVLMARHKDGVLDKIGTLYIIFIIAVPSLAYIFMFKGIGVRLFKLPSSFDANDETFKMYILPIISLALPSVANLMKWIRRYMIDQMNSDYVKFARSGGLSENEIFSKHILKNAIIPIVHGIPGSVLGALTGAIITESVYVVPGVGKVLTEAIAAYDNSVIVGITVFYSFLSVVAIILGDLLMAAVDPRISFTEKGKFHGRKIK